MDDAKPLVSKPFVPNLEKQLNTYPLPYYRAVLPFLPRQYEVVQPLLSLRGGQQKSH
jgi:hypothetical protein